MPLADAASRQRIVTSLDETLFVQAGAGSGKTTSLVDRVVALVQSGEQMRHIAAITFTEKAAAELLDRVRRAFERRQADPNLDEHIRTRFRTALEQVDAAAISTLHAFAQRVLTEHPIEAQLPPNVQVLDEVASEIEFDDRWRRFRDHLLGDPALERTLLLAFAADVRMPNLRHLAATFNDNWDLIEEPQRVPWPAEEPPEVKVEELLRRIDDLLDDCRACSDGGDGLLHYLTGEIAAYAQRLRDAPDEYERMR
ncbi:MAG: UvrD-helicase domain-containing protein, partial [Actinomycetota bacterium]|nr:UvrD-helicase domain-containing protein [Actinomycetota bacterium]